MRSSVWKSGHDVATESHGSRGVGPVRALGPARNVGGVALGWRVVRRLKRWHVERDGRHQQRGRSAKMANLAVGVESAYITAVIGGECCRLAIGLVPVLMMTEVPLARG